MVLSFINSALSF